MGLKNKLRKWLFPDYEIHCREYQSISEFMSVIRKGMVEVSDQPLTIKGDPVFILGSISNTNVDIHSEPHIDLYLAKVNLDALRLDGINHIITNNVFKGAETTIKFPK